MSEVVIEEYHIEGPNENNSQRRTVTGTFSYSKTFCLTMEEGTTLSQSEHENQEGTEMILSEGTVMTTTRNRPQNHAEIITA